jgi:DNA polymerase-3 subunit epsilon
MTRHLVIIDLETTGLNVATCQPLEVAAINTVTGEELTFVPFVTKSALSEAEPMALKVNRYYERGVWEEMLPDEDTNRQYYGTLADILKGNTLGGSNPRFDAAVLSRFTGEVWHHRLADIANYAAPAMGRPPHNLPGLADVCKHFDIVNHEAHSAYYDAQATAACFRELAKQYES